MTPKVSMAGDRLLVDDSAGVINGRHLSQLAFWGFTYEPATRLFAAKPVDLYATLDKVLAYLARQGISCATTADIQTRQAELATIKTGLDDARRQGVQFKGGEVKTAETTAFLDFVATQLARRPKEHQLKAALHLLAVKNGANFSVPGSGKTTVVLTVFEWLKKRAQVDALFVVGPPSCFGPWQQEYRDVIGAVPRTALLAGGVVGDRRSAYASRKEDLCDLYLTSFQTLQHDWEHVRQLFSEAGAKFYFVVDEAHYIKQLDGVWANAVLNVAQHATYRCVLTGTPFPRAFSDAFNLFDVLWPHCPPLSHADRGKIEFYTQKQNDAEAVALLSRTVGPLFYRVRKSDLGLAPQQFNEPVLVPMAPHEKRVYDAILDRIRDLSKEDYFRDIDLLVRLRRGRIMRLRQTVSYAKLLGSAVLEYSENLLEGNLPLADVIRHYDDLEIPAKLATLRTMVKDLRLRGEKVLIWSNFVETLKLICRHLAADGHGVKLIYGETPTEKASVQDEETREKIIAAFIDPQSGIDILVANPAACAESISLHKTCAHAIYYDLSYNCAQYLQSLDRIHRVGGSEEKVAHYYFLQYAESVDQDILGNLRRKSDRMSAIIDHDYPVYGMDMFAADDELEAYERLFR